MAAHDENVVWHPHPVTVAQRERLHGHRGVVLWFTGLSGSGKSTVAGALEEALHQQGVSTYLLDGDNVRHGLCSDLGFSDDDRKAYLLDPALLEQVYVSFHIISQTGNASKTNVDLWVIGITEGDTLLAEYLEADAELNLPDRADNVKLQDNIIKIGNHLARTFSDDAAAVSLGSYLRDFYEANPGYDGGSFLQVRLNPDKDLSSTATANGWDIPTMEAPTSATDPRPFTFRQPALVLYQAVPEPDSIALLVGGAIVAGMGFGVGGWRTSRRRPGGVTM